MAEYLPCGVNAGLAYSLCLSMFIIAGYAAKRPRMKCNCIVNPATIARSKWQKKRQKRVRPAQKSTPMNRLAAIRKLDGAAAKKLASGEGHLFALFLCIGDLLSHPLDIMMRAGKYKTMPGGVKIML